MGKGSTTHQLQKFEALGYSPLHQLSSSLGVERSGRGEQGPPARLVCRKGKSTPTSLASKPAANIHRYVSHKCGIRTNRHTEYHRAAAEYHRVYGY